MYKRQKRYYDERYKAHDLPTLAPGQPVWVRDLMREGTVHRLVAPRSYEIETPKGRVTRNASALVPEVHGSAPASHPVGDPDSVRGGTEVHGPTLANPASQPNAQPMPINPMDTTASNVTDGATTSTTSTAGTRPQRSRRPPEYLKDYVR